MDGTVSASNFCVRLPIVITSLNCAKDYMFEPLKHYIAVQKAARHRERRRRDFARDIRIAQGKKNYEEVESLKNYQHMELSFVDEEIDIDNSDYIIALAHRYLVPLPEGDEHWQKSEAFGRGYLSRKGAAQVRNDIRAERKAMWDYWQARITLVLSVFGSVVALLAYFKR